MPCYTPMKGCFKKSRFAGIRFADCLLFQLRRNAALFQILDEHLGPALVVVQRFFLFRQLADVSLPEIALDEPVRGARGQHEQLFHALRPGQTAHVVED